jgi:hypothetical protein
VPIHLDDVDVVSEVAGLSSALIVPCNMCPAITAFLRSAPFEEHIKALQSQLAEQRVATKVFRSNIPYQWFLCMWSVGRRAKLGQDARQHDAVIVLGCDSAAATVRDAVKNTDAKVIEGMEVVGFLNAKMRLRAPFNVSFDDCKMVPMSPREKDEGGSA